MSKIVNPAAGDRYFTIGGVAIGSTTQPKVNSGSMAGVLSSSIAGDDVAGYQPQIQHINNVDHESLQTIHMVEASPSANESKKGDNARNKLRSVKTATAIRNDQWVPYSGSWSVDPSVSDDTSALALTSDSAARSTGNTRVVHGDGVVPDITVL